MVKASTILYVASAVVFAVVALGAATVSPLWGVVLFVSGVAAGSAGN